METFIVVCGLFCLAFIIVGFLALRKVRITDYAPMNEVIILQGIPGSGKTTYAKNWVKENPTKRIRVNQDDIRNMLGPYWIKEREHLVHLIQNAVITSAMEEGYNIIVDNMNLNPKAITRVVSLVKVHNEEHCNYQIMMHQMETPLEECIQRDAKREKPIGEEVIRDIYNTYIG